MSLIKLIEMLLIDCEVILLHDDDELYHWGLKKDHKYIAKIKMPGGKFRYFYDKEEYQRYLNKGKNVVEKLFGKAKSALDDVSEKFKSDSKDDGSKSKESLLDKFSDKSAKNAFFLIPRSSFKKAKNWVSKKFGFGDEKDSDNSTISSKEKKDHKYIAKVKLSNGKYRYFYDQNEYDAYLNRLKYQKNEPDFMKKVKNIDSNDILTRDENMDKVNEAYDPYNSATSENCANCSAAYELRMRGYDVEAKAVDVKYNNRGDRFYDYFENAEVLCVYGDGSTHTANEKYVRKLWGDGTSLWDDWTNKEDSDYYKNKQSYSSKSLEKAIKDNNPPGSRGMIDVDWKSGGAHSIVYEVDNSGKVTIRDSQTYDKYDVSELANKVGRVRICRTDNLQVKPSIKNAVETNTDKEREYYVDKDQLQYYEED